MTTLVLISGGRCACVGERPCYEIKSSPQHYILEIVGALVALLVVDSQPWGPEVILCQANASGHQETNPKVAEKFSQHELIAVWAAGLYGVVSHWNESVGDPCEWEGMEEQVKEALACRAPGVLKRWLFVSTIVRVQSVPTGDQLS